jgi:hypothetical protein
MVHDYFNPYNSPYDAFINYMNVLSDYTERVNEAYEQIMPTEPEYILKKIKDYESKIKQLYEELKKPAIIEKVKPIFAAIEKTKDEFLALTDTPLTGKNKTKPKTKPAPGKKKTDSTKTQTKSTPKPKKK